MDALYPDAVGLDPIRSHSDSLASLAVGAGADTPVPTCGEWTLSDLIWHLLEVQEFWSYIIANRPAGPDGYVRPDRPDDDSLAEGLRAASSALIASLEAASADERAWSWSENQTVGFTLRRQSHEALVHAIDGALALSREIPQIDKYLAADGVDEMVRVMLSGVPEGATFTRTSGIVDLRADDTGDAWVMAFGRMTGTVPGSSDTYDLEALDPADGEQADTVISGSAVALDLWLWGRGDLEGLEVTGQADLASRLRSLVASTTQ